MINEKQILEDAYTLISELWCSPQDVDMKELKKDSEGVIPALENIEGNCALLLFKFLNSKPIPEEKYIEFFELEPKCSLYLGSHSFDEPKTCAGAGVSDRNKYMIDLNGIYKHFGQEISGRELPDYLPLMVNFLSLTVRKNDDLIREKFISEYVLPFLPPMRKRLEELKTPYLHLFDALEKVINYDLSRKSLTLKEKTYVE